MIHEKKVSTENNRIKQSYMNLLQPTLVSLLTLGYFAGSGTDDVKKDKIVLVSSNVNVK